MQDLTTGEVRRVYADGGSVVRQPAGRPTAPGCSRPAQTATPRSCCSSSTSTARPAEQIMPAKGEEAAFAVPGPWLPDGSGFLLRTDVGREFVGLARFDLETRSQQLAARSRDGTSRRCCSRKTGGVLVWTRQRRRHLRAPRRRDERRHGRRRAAGADAAGRPDLRAVARAPTAARSRRSLVTGGRRDQRRRRRHRTGRRARSDGSPTRWPASRRRPSNRSSCRSRPHDGREIPAWLYRPAGDGPFPVVLSIHGGPEAQERPAYNYGGLYQYLVANGIAVLAPNVRGSNGYGRTYQRLVLRDWGGGDMADFEAAAQYLQRSPTGRSATGSACSAARTAGSRR